MAGMQAFPRFPTAAAACLLLAACGTTPAPPAPAVPEVTPAQRLAAVQAAAGAADTELDVQPLRDPQVADLRERAAAALAAGQAEAAAEALNQALLAAPDDPAVLQERAEVALLQGQYDRAETLARRAYDLGSRVGPMCRRHWATIEQSRLARGQAENAASARAQLAACTVPGVQRF
ncbi:tetratricopeptide repeat protein [Pseudoxanthomonas sp. SGT-18]|uniref:tetratricopeptide repeat protein n=1 Tax=Pseudoxanthomonas sp. SGT-18 TaxID=2493087 RepID=UPI000F62A883|nr:tetratricopeptide repeat protein [Pseudoxanthomonas sp. SGT-18]